MLFSPNKVLYVGQNGGDLSKASGTIFVRLHELLTLEFYISEGTLIYSDAQEF